MPRKTICTYAALGILAPAVAFVVFIYDERVPRYICVLTALWCTVILCFLLTAGSCRAPAEFGGQQLY